MDIHKWHQMTVKIALALAIIKSKPEGKNVREYTEELSRLVLSHDSNLKARVRELESEVLRLRQQLILQDICGRSDLDKGDGGYSCTEWLLTPYNNPQTRSQVRFNEAHRSTRGIIERTFGLLKMRFRCLDRSGGAMQYAPEKVAKIILVCCILHNIAIKVSVRSCVLSYLISCLYTSRVGSSVPVSDKADEPSSQSVNPPVLQATEGTPVANDSPAALAAFSESEEDVEISDCQSSLPAAQNMTASYSLQSIKVKKVNDVPIKKFIYRAVLCNLTYPLLCRLSARRILLRRPGSGEAVHSLRWPPKLPPASQSSKRLRLRLPSRSTGGRGEKEAVCRSVKSKITPPAPKQSKSRLPPTQHRWGRDEAGTRRPVTSGVKSDVQKSTEGYDSMNHIEDDSGCDMSNNDRIKSDSLSFQQCEWTEANLSDTASASENIQIIKHQPSVAEHFSCHIQFLNHLLGLRKLTTTQTPLPDFSKYEKDSCVVSDSVSGLLNGLISLYRNPQLSISRFQTEAVITVASLLTECCLPKYVLDNCQKIVKDFTEKIIHSIVSSCHLNRFQMQQSMENCLILLGNCPLIRDHLINLLFLRVKCFVEELLLHQKNQTKYDITQYENMFSICSVLERLLQNRKDKENTSDSELLGDEIKMFICNLDQSILCICDDFPLFCIYLWKLGTLFSCK
ncbi:meiosis-specific protein MEI4 [Bombina bombina]|uniref:meiosis-specific protein MEI4 n=1 Tax=Bombina bombina TaxID=8345 RepID=UPI00235AE934|nr:meiosis-specific protein MEI4 [Bombina bombina]